MEVERIWFTKNLQDDKKAKKEYKRIADLAKLTLKFNKKIEVFSIIQNQIVGYVKDSEEGIIPGWCGVDFIMDDYVPDFYFKKTGLVNDITFGTIIDSKHENQEIEIVDQLII